MLYFDKSDTKIFPTAISSCGIIVTPPITTNIDVILALPGEPTFANPIDITELVSFGQPAGVSSADYEVTVKIGDLVNFEQPQGLQPGDKLWYDFANWFDAADQPIDFGVVDQFVQYIIPPDAQNVQVLNPEGFVFVSDKVIFRNINANPDNDLNWKYDLIVFIERNGIFTGPYKIDPKLKIKTTTSL